MRPGVEEQSSMKDRTRQGSHWVSDLGLNPRPGVEEQSSRKDRTRQGSHWFADLGLNP